ncbi:hypothetical protein [Staphylococcus lutrae]|uniref:Uncharacterized protein n=1 Tax=Staphylococcus lutrae TaxID=155085 RepID=A0AAC9RVP8_9STAP|nr:hypothetical protein [Staphylococcus lutrae]ARJ50692.1 hypothetical protein B5P37_04840 [Staphylococcus lutrae]
MKGSLTSQSNTQGQPPNKNPKWLIILIICLIMIALAGLIYGGYRVSQLDIRLKLKTDQKVSDTSQTQIVHIDVQSDDFSQNFMNTDRISGYQGFQLGATRQQTEMTHGPPERMTQYAGQQAASYGNIAVTYDAQEKINHVYVTPNNVTLSQFIAVHQAPNTIDGEIWYYDKNKNNRYTIKVYTSDNRITAIENIPQIAY